MVVPDSFKIGDEFEPTKCDELLASGAITHVIVKKRQKIKSFRLIMARSSFFLAKNDKIRVERLKQMERKNVRQD